MSSLKKPPPRRAMSVEQERLATRRQDRIETLQHFERFQNVPSNELARVVDLATVRAFVAGVPLSSHQRQPSQLFIIERGKVRLDLHPREGQPIAVAELGPGDCWGEGTLFSDLLRELSATAETSVLIIQIALADLRRVLSATPQLNAVLRQSYTRRLVESTLARVPLLAGLSLSERKTLADRVQPAQHGRGSLIVEAGQSGDALYIIEAGQVVVEQEENPIATLKEGHFFGEMSLLTHVPHSASVRAITPTELLMLPANEFHRLLDQRPEFAEHLRSVIERRLNQNNALRDDANRARELRLAVNQGVLRGSHILVRTPSLCPPDCRLCEEACQTRHGQSRLRLNGTPLGPLDVLDACRQCSVGAECVEACPEDAFEWNQAGALIINDRCTGCAACIPACPYGVIGQTNHALQPKLNPLQQLLDGLRRKKADRPVIGLEPITNQRADKCDLCHGHADLACRTNCPTGSLRLIPVEELFPL